VVEGARLESVFRGNSNVGSNPTLSASFYVALRLQSQHSQRSGIPIERQIQLSHHKYATDSSEPFSLERQSWQAHDR
jgi:hypothetical protein